LLHGQEKSENETATKELETTGKYNAIDELQFNKHVIRVK
jgi:hypothetical protein